MEILENKIAEMTEDLEDVKVGSEEYERVSNSIAAIAKANADDKKAETEAKAAKVRKWTDIITAGAAVGTVLVGVAREFLKRRTNKDLMKFEETDSMTSKAFDNR